MRLKTSRDKQKKRKEEKQVESNERGGVQVDVQILGLEKTVLTYTRSIQWQEEEEAVHLNVYEPREGPLGSREEPSRSWDY
jgi:hypothetical protein